MKNMEFRVSMTTPVAWMTVTVMIPDDYDQKTTTTHNGQLIHDCVGSLAFM